MAIEFTCPACGGTLRVRDETIGRVVRCGGCMSMLRVPETEPVQESPPGVESEAEQTLRPIPPPPATETDSPQQIEELSSTSPRRGLRFWLTITSAFLVIGAIGCCGLAAFLVPAPDWREHDSQQGGFRCELPADPRNDMARRLNVPGGRTVEGTFLWTRAENYAIIFWDDKPANPLPVRQTDAERLDAQVKMLTSGPNVQSVTRTESVEVSGFPGREFEFRYKNGGTVTGRVVIADSRIYVIWAGGRFTRPENENVRRFLDSFEITDPNLLAESDRRAKLANAGIEQLRKRMERARIKEAGAIAAAAAVEAVTAELEHKP
jgi:hypothetical protein